jgi:hypothetical protein
MNELPDLNKTLRDMAFEEINRVCFLTESYSRSIAEAAFRGDEATVRMHLDQMRACVVSMIQTYKFSLEGTGNGQGVPAKDRRTVAHREDQRSGDAVA